MPLRLVGALLALTFALMPGRLSAFGDSLAFSLQCWPARTVLDATVAEAQIVDLVNMLRAEHELAPLTYEPLLGDVGRARSWNVYERQDISHTVPGFESSPYWIMAQVRGATGAGENLGISCAPNDEVVGSLYNSWVESPSHLRNMLEPQFNRLGVGIVEIELPGTPFTVKYVTQVFARAPGAIASL